MRKYISQAKLTRSEFFRSSGRNYPIGKRTIAKKITYYVTRNFAMQLDQYYGGQLGMLEKDVKYDYKIKILKDCEREEKHSKFVS